MSWSTVPKIFTISHLYRDWLTLVLFILASQQTWGCPAGRIPLHANVGIVPISNTGSDAQPFCPQLCTGFPQTHLTLSSQLCQHKPCTRPKTIPSPTHPHSPPPTQPCPFLPRRQSFLYFLIPPLHPALGKSAFEEGRGGGGGQCCLWTRTVPAFPTHTPSIFLKLIIESANYRI